MESRQISKKELGRVEVREHLKARGMVQKKASEALGIIRHQVKRLWENYQEKGLLDK